ncbi:MAG: S8 family peptidase [Egibacteraceae bacterium]
MISASGRRRTSRAWTRGVAALVLVLVLPALPAAATRPGGAANPNRAEPSSWTGPDVVAGTLLVTTASSDAATRLAQGGFKAASAAGARGARRIARRIAQVTVQAGQEAKTAEALRRQPDVMAVEPNLRRSFTAAPNDPLYPRQWAHRIAKVEQAWTTTIGSPDVTVAVLDSGVDGRHLELAQAVVEQVDASTGTIHPGAVDNDPCAIGHGTLVAGVIGAAGNNTAAITGVDWAVSLVDVSLTSDAIGCLPGPTDAGVVAALDYVTNVARRRVDVVNMSFGSPAGRCPTAIQTAIDAARAKGITLVASAGNEEDVPIFAGQPSVPASCSGVISVGGTGPTGQIGPYSRTNQWVDLVAPGGDVSKGSGPDDDTALVLSTKRDGGERTVEGTSFSSPYVAGVAALLLSEKPSLTPDQIEAVLEGSAAERGTPGRDPAYGWGLVQADAAMQLVAGGHIPALRPDPAFPMGSGAVMPRVAADRPTQLMPQVVTLLAVVARRRLRRCCAPVRTCT